MKKSLLFLLCFGLVQTSPLLYGLLFDYQESFLYPTLLSHSPLIVPVFVIFNLKNRFTKAFIVVWIAWLHIGELKILDYYGINPFYISMDEGCMIYTLFLAVMSLGILWHDMRMGSRQVSPDEQQQGRLVYDDFGWLTYPLMAFPLVWFVDFIRNVGYIPIFSGSDVTDKMYNLDYGLVYNYGFFNCVSAVLLYDRALKSKTRTEKITWLVLTGLAVLITSIDSKRLFLLISIGSIFLYDKIITGKFSVNLKSVGLILITALLYVGLQNMRLGSSSEAQFKREGMPMGVEFREYIRAVNEFEPGQIPGYNLTTSTLANLVNGALLGAVGFNKAELNSQDSALTFMTIFDPDNTLGIRTGLISELYFAYDFWGLLVIFAFGYAVSYVTYVMLTTQRKSTLVLLVVIFSLLTLTVFGQSSVTAGSLCLLFYLYVLIGLVNRRQRSQATLHTSREQVESAEPATHDLSV